MQTSADRIDFVISIVESVAESVDASIVVLDSELRIKAANSSFYRIFGTSPEEAQGQLLCPLSNGRWHLPELRHLLERVLTEDNSFQDLEIEHEFPFIGHRLLLLSGRRIDALQLLVLVIDDVTDRVERDVRLAAIVESAEDAILSQTLDGKIVSWNSAAERIYGYAGHEVIGRSIAFLPPPDRAGEMQAAMERIRRGEKVSHFETKSRRKDGRIIDVAVTVSPLRGRSGVITGASVVARDITEMKRNQESALARQKLETVGRMAGSIAHDFNNLLGAVLSNVELAQMELAPASAADDELQKIRNLAVYGSEIVRQLMTYAGQDTGALEFVDLSRIVSEMLELLKASISKHALLETDLKCDLPMVRVNPAQIRQVVMNLIINASESIGEHDGIIRISVARVAPGPNSEVVDSDSVAHGDCVRLDISDTGSGMTAEAQGRIFEPFFTTKASGRGLGLAVARNAVQSWHGAITFASEVGKGTSFQIRLPCAEERVVESKTPAVSVEEQVPPASRTILVVEDEDLLRLAVSKMLRNIGFSVLTARDGFAAVDLIKAHENDLAAILLDVSLPGMTSQEVLANTRRIRPNVKVIVTSAYSQEMIKVSCPALPLDHFLRKPYTFANLTHILGETPS